jgi:acetyl-CoA carboxylase biotin carboxyl carrier protein
MTKNEKKMTVAVKPEDIEALIELFEASDWDEMHLEIDGLELFLSSDPKARIAAQPQHASMAHVPASAHAHATTPQGMGHLAPPPAPAKEVSSAPEGCIAVKAPNLGTFYRAPKPGAASYVELGQSVTADTEICLIEVMKLFTSVRAGMAGIIREICVEDAEMVEYGQTLFFIEPALPWP